MGTTFAILSGIVLFALLGKQYRGGPENLSTKPRKRSIRAKWKGAGEPPAEFKTPKYKVGQKVTIRSPHEKDQFEGKTVTITERIYYEVVEADPSGTLLPVPGAETWGYVVDLTFDGMPLNVAETSLVPGSGAVAGDDTDWIFQVEYLKQVWPLIEGSRASTATLRKAMKIAAALDGNITFTQQGNPEDIALVTEMLTHLRQNVAAGDDATYLCGDLPIDRILAPSSAGSGDAEFGYSWKKFGRALKKAAKWCWKNKYVRYGLAAAAQALNVVAPGAGVALGAAILVVDKATSKDKKVAEPELKKIQDIKDKADAGDPKAKDALATLTIVREAQKEAAKEGTPTDPEPIPDLKAAVQE